ncbi:MULTISPECIES: anti-sigma factor [Rhodococcus]|uniref:anti-sigma factor n=1 Tax=Rhodococcus TaxID=1827 RepID=UPI00042EEA70|nr:MULTISPECIES: anti-sigma factor [Rhodococcus]RZK74508.1 MAG: anti-sigma factor [Rhodococcus sp. (in: high G+C Gram-positive bacteria)]AHK30064.1 Anti-sigma-K factor rskA [Rhodococcus opacus PD630]KXX58659.1 anti-sigma factor [Rhodococcus sp. LB1]PBC59048.1 anti-sigma factor [Rhodococcus sp. ACPA1]UDG99757.1 anti-sigma factor [Rhodococcus opacus PD630]
MNDELVGMAYPYALDALDDSERRELDTDLATTDEDTRSTFTDEVRRIREAFAVVSAVGAVEPPPRVRTRVLDEVRQSASGPTSLTERRSRRRRWQVAVAAAAAIGVLAGGTVIVRQLTEGPSPTVAEQVLDASDVHSSTSAIAAGGSATANYSKSQDAVVFVLDGVAPPSADTVYQLWLMPASGDAPVPAGTISPGDVQPTTTVVLDDVGSMSKLAVTVEPPGGSPQPTSEPFAVLQLS